MLAGRPIVLAILSGLAAPPAGVLSGAWTTRFRSPPSAASDIEPQERARLLGRFGRRFAAGESLFQEGSPALAAFLLQEGRVRLFKRVGVPTAVSRCSSRAICSARAPCSLGAYGSTAVALSDGSGLALDRATFRSLLANYPLVASRVVDQLVRRLRDAEDQIEIHDAARPAIEGDERAAQAGGPTHRARRAIVSPVELSTRVGLDVEAVKHTVQRLRERHYIRIAGERIEIPDVDALRRLHALLGTKDELGGRSDES